MICSRCVVPFLALYMLLDDTSAATLPNRLRNKRRVSWLEQELPHTWVDGSDQRDLSVDDGGETSRGVNSPETILTPREHLPVRCQNQNHRKASDKRRKVAPLDSIGSFQMSSFRNRKDEPEIHWEEYRR